MFYIGQIQFIFDKIEMNFLKFLTCTPCQIVVFSISLYAKLICWKHYIFEEIGN